MEISAGLVDGQIMLIAGLIIVEPRPQTAWMERSRPAGSRSDPRAVARDPRRAN
jgi:hypothetical protein